jgi:hypothetical protein
MDRTKGTLQVSRLGVEGSRTRACARVCVCVCVCVCVMNSHLLAFDKRFNYMLVGSAQMLSLGRVAVNRWDRPTTPGPPCASNHPARHS